jgi:UPF0755 protein
MKSRIIAFICLIIVGLVWLQPLNLGRVEITIPKGATGRQIVNQLAELHIVRDRDEFLFWLKIAGREKGLKSGTYELSRYMNPLYLIERLSRGGKTDITVTIPEGLTIEETADILQAKGLVIKDDFLKLCRDPGFIQELGISAKSLEGYLFPDTYSFNATQGDSEILENLIRNFRLQIKKINLDSSASLERILILASLVEKEAKFEDERPIIARVFINRLKTDRPLESCATVWYALKTEGRLNYPKKRLTEADLKFQSRYNTYIHLGLPPEPICSPGFKSLEAALNPADVDYLYFVARGDGRHHFSRTFREHLQAKEFYSAKK